jgi:hypothetical protein
MNTTTQKLAAVFGVVFILIAIAGFIAPGGMAMQPTDPVTAAQVFGMFPVNLVHNIVHLLFGLWGLAASRSWAGSKSFFTTAGIIYAVLVVCGWFFPDGFGFIPLGGNDIWLHAVLAVVMMGIGFSAKNGAVARPVSTV